MKLTLGSSQSLDRQFNGLGTSTSTFAGCIEVEKSILTLLAALNAFHSNLESTLVHDLDPPTHKHIIRGKGLKLDIRNVAICWKIRDHHAIGAVEGLRQFYHMTVLPSKDDEKLEASSLTVGLSLNHRSRIESNRIDIR